MLDIGFQELLVVGIIALLVFGPYKLPELGRALGRAMREFRRASDEFRSTIETNLNIHGDSSPPPSPPPSAPVTEPATSAPPTTVAAGADGDAASVTGTPPADGGGVFGAERAPGPDSLGGFAPVEPFCHQRGGRLLHRTPCGWVSRIPEAERVALKTAQEGRDLGLVACPACDPRDESDPA